MAPPKGKRNGDRPLSEKEMRFVQVFDGNVMAAARAAGYKGENTGFKLMKKPRIAKAIAAKQAKAIAVSGARLGRKIDISRNDIIMGLADIAKTGDSESARVTAYGKLADIFGLMPKSNGKDMDIFAGWTDEELLHYRETGELPIRFGLSAESDGTDKPAIPPSS